MEIDHNDLEINTLITENAQLKEKLEIAVEALKFYSAHHDSWCEATYNDNCDCLMSNTAIKTLEKLK